MTGKVLKVASNDLYGNVDDRLVRVYACFQHLKYNNYYVIFSFEGETKKLCFGSIHMKSNSLVIFEVKSNVSQYIMEFIDEYLNSNLVNFKLVDVNNIMKIELVSFNTIEYDKLSVLDEKSIPKPVIQEEVVKVNRKPVFLYVLVVFLILLAVGLTVIYLNPEWFSIKYKSLECTNKLYDKKMDLYYNIDKKIFFDENVKLERIEVIKSYNFLDSSKYYEFKNNNRQEDVFTNGGNFKYLDDQLVLMLFYDETTVIDDYKT